MNERSGENIQPTDQHVNVRNEGEEITAESLRHYFSPEDLERLGMDPEVEDINIELNALADDMNLRGQKISDLFATPHADFSFWETGIKEKSLVTGEDGKSHTVNKIIVVPSRARRYRVRPQTRGIDVASLITPAATIKMYGTKSTARKVRKEKIAVDLPDIQFALRLMKDGSFTPVHDPRAMDVALQISKDVQPDLIVSGGDETDLPELSSFTADSTHFMHPKSIDYGFRGTHSFLAQVRTDNPNAQIEMLGSNHLDRYIAFMLKNAPQLFEMTDVNDPDGPPLWSVERRLGLKALGINFNSGYKASFYQINDRLITLHGDKAKSGGSTAHEYLKEFTNQSVMFHHTHRMERAIRTHRDTMKVGGKTIQAFSNGCLASISGSVPSGKTAVTTMGDVVQNTQDWQNGMGIVHYTEGNGAFHVEQIVIDHTDGYRAHYNGKTYTPRPSAERKWEHFTEGMVINEFPEVNQDLRVAS
jgi:hypothetical protein